MLGRSLGVLGRSLDVLGRSLGVLGRSQGMLGHSLGVQRRSLGELGRNQGVLERSLSALGAIVKAHPACQCQSRMPCSIQTARANSVSQASPARKGQSNLLWPVQLGRQCNSMCCAHINPTCYTRCATRSLVQLDVLCICCWRATGVR